MGQSLNDGSLKSGKALSKKIRDDKRSKRIKDSRSAPKINMSVTRK